MSSRAALPARERWDGESRPRLRLGIDRAAGLTGHADFCDRRAMLGVMDDRRQADLPWAHAPLAARIVAAVIIVVPAFVMGGSLAGSRGVVVGALLGLFWGGLGVLVAVFPTVLQRWSREQAMFAPILAFGVLLFGLLFLTTMPTSIAVFFSLIIAGIFAFISVGRRRRATPPEPTRPTRGRRHS
jgi:hypothetical protein